MMAALRRRLEGAGCIVGIALFLCAVGVLFLLAELQSPSAVLWTGQRVVGRDTGGVVLYPLDGHVETLIVADEPATTPEHPVTVFADPKNPSAAMVDNAVIRWLDAALVLAPFLAAALAVLIGIRRSRRGKRRQLAAEGGFGQGFDPAELRRRREARGDPPHAP